MSSSDPQKEFWQWFKFNLDRFEKFGDVQDPLLDEISSKLKPIDEKLVCEITTPNAEARELVISADGIEESFPSVIQLVEKAPLVSGWKITAFRPRTDIGLFTLMSDGREYYASDFYFWLQREETNVDLILYVPGLSEENRGQFVEVCYLLLDMALGEYDVVKKIRYIDHHPLPDNGEDVALKPLTELPKEFDDLYARLNPRKE